MASSETPPGELYRTWSGARAGITVHDRRSITAVCEFNEDAALKAYRQALQSEAMPAETKQLLEGQLSRLQRTHDTIKRYRDMADAIQSA